MRNKQTKETSVKKKKKGRLYTRESVRFLQNISGQNITDTVPHRGTFGHIQTMTTTASLFMTIRGTQMHLLDSSSAYTYVQQQQTRNTRRDPPVNVYC